MTAHPFAEIKSRYSEAMDDNLVGHITHRSHAIAAPVSLNSARNLLTRLAPPEQGRVLDLGCGEGVWLLTILEAFPTLQGIGVDISEAALDKARISTKCRGLEGRVSWKEADASSWVGDSFDIVMCIGSSHAFGGLSETLTATRRFLRPGGRVLLGDVIWEKPPSSKAQEVLESKPDDLPDLATLVDTVERHGFETGYGHISTLEEWDDYEWSWTGSLVEWALQDTPAPSASERQEALELANGHRNAWLGGYRQELGFATIVLHDAKTLTNQER